MSKYLDQAIKLLNPQTRDHEPAAGDLAFSEARVREVNADGRSVTALVSTPNVDRYEEIVEPKAFGKWLSTFMANPVFVAGHVYGGWSGEPTVIGHWSEMRITDEGLIGTAQFARTPLAEQYWQLYAEKHMRAFSVGWLTHEWEMREYELGDGGKKRIRVFTEVELIEVSAVAIPANRESLVRAASALAGPSGGGHDAQQSAAMARAMHEEISKDIKAAMTAERTATETLIKQLLATEPGSPLCNLIQDVVEVSRGAQPDGDEHEDDALPPAAWEEDAARQLRELNAALKRK